MTESVHVAEGAEAELAPSVSAQHESTCLSVGESVLMQTALTEVQKLTTLRRSKYVCYWTPAHRGRTLLKSWPGS